MSKLFATKLFASDASSPSELLTTYSSLVERVGHYLFGIRDSFSADQLVDIKECIRDGMRRVYLSHTWSFFRPVTTITTVDGTATYSLPTGYESIASEMHYAQGESDFYPPVRQRHDTEIRKRQQDDDATNRPLYFSVRTAEFDPTIGSVRKLVLFPTPDDAYVLYAKMTLRPTMIDSTNIYPIGGEQLAQVFIEACLAAAEHGFDEKTGEHENLLQYLLPLAIRADLEAASPRRLGPDDPAGENTDHISRSVRTGSIYIDGSVM